MGQFRSGETCPLCGRTDDSKWTCASCTILVSVHRELIRNLQHWRSLYEACEVPDSLLSPLNHREYSLWDATTFYEHRVLLPERMQQSIHWYLYQNMKESDAALRMGIAETNPVGTYATIGLTSLLAQAVRGELTGYLVELEGEVHASV